MGIPTACDRSYVNNCLSDYGGGFGAGIATPTVSGTSLSSPTAAGIAVLLRQRHPDWTAPQVMNAMRASALDLGPAGWDPDTGYGRIQAQTADTYTPDTTPPAVTQLTPTTAWQRTVRITYQITPGTDIGDLYATGGHSTVFQNQSGGNEVVSWDKATGVLVMDHEVSGSTGRKTFTFHVADTSGNTTSIPVAFNRDVTPPTLTNTTASSVQRTLPVRLTGLALDDGGSGVDQITATPCGATGPTRTYPVAADGSYEMVFSDLAVGEVACMDVRVTDKVGISASTYVRHSAVYIPPFASTPAPAPTPARPSPAPPAPPAPAPAPSAPAPAPAPAPVPSWVPGPAFTNPKAARLTGTRLKITFQAGRRTTMTLTVPGTTYTRRITTTPGRTLTITLPARIARTARRVILRTPTRQRSITIRRTR